MAVDSFFEGSSNGKRKRGGVKSNGRGGGGSSTFAAGGSRRGRVNGTHAGRGENRGYKGKGREDQALPRHAKIDDEEIEESDDDDEEDQDDVVQQEEEFESDTEADRRETPAQKRLRLAQQYLDSLKAAQEEQVGFDAADLERDLINERLQKDVLEVSGKLHLRIADKISYIPSSYATTSNRVHRLPLTCAIASQDSKYLFTASKDGSIAKWDISSFASPSSASSSSSSSSLPPLQPEASTSTAATPSSNKERAQIVKLDFIPKRIPPKRRKNSDSKGKAAIARNQPSQDADTPGHTDEIYSLAISGDGTRLASGGKDRRIGVWDISSDHNTPGEGCKWIQGLRGHKDTISSLSFRMNTNQLYTSSFDRTVKIYDILSASYIETLFGHQDKIHDISILRNELAVTSGGRDKTLRYWKIKDETQLVFRAGGTSKIRSVLEGGLEDIEDDDDALDKEDNKNNKKAISNEKKFVEGSVDCVAMIDDTHFISGGDSGTISLWNVNKKKPIFSQPIAHGLNEYHSESEGIIGNPRWVTSLASLPYSDLFASGSWDGKIRFWRISEDIKSFTPMGTVDALGYINSIQMNIITPSSTEKGKKENKKNHSQALGGGSKRKVLVTAALAQEHKFGRWMKLKEAKNQALLAIIEEKS